MPSALPSKRPRSKSMAHAMRAQPRDAFSAPRMFQLQLFRKPLRASGKTASHQQRASASSAVCGGRESLPPKSLRGSKSRKRPESLLVHRTPASTRARRHLPVIAVCVRRSVSSCRAILFRQAQHAATRLTISVCAICFHSPTSGLQTTMPHSL